ncbi:M23 family metallopeptidase [Oceanobacter mangrovi]|uniref:M23 family metallopeptidase n=1 Tax=Oceanobacter mangrovi TaxID=2862510 RepID=UPI001C8D5EEA|nr:M23 family metallopeptidase [Oceanobacter mangrovi]
MKYLHLSALVLTAVFASGCSINVKARELPRQDLIPGGVAMFDIGVSQQAPKVTFDNQPVMLIPQTTSAGTDWHAVVGIELKSEPGPRQLSINGKTVDFQVGQHQYAEQRLTVQNKHVNPSEEALKRIRSESQLMRTAFQSFSEAGKDTWQPMIWPAQGPLSSPFGLQRFFNGERRNPHTGLDIAAPQGAEIIAPASGKVVQTGDYYFNGNTVMIDHGQGLVTMFCHLSRIDVKAGDLLKQGDHVGLVGATGRATGPHLHWTLSLNNARVNPKLFMQESLLPSPVATQE